LTEFKEAEQCDVRPLAPCIHYRRLAIKFLEKMRFIASIECYLRKDRWELSKKLHAAAI